jgi:hypothetical protein
MTRGTISPTFPTPNPPILGRAGGGGRVGGGQFGPGREEREEEEERRQRRACRLTPAAPGGVVRQGCRAGASGAAGPGPRPLHAPRLASVAHLPRLCVWRGKGHLPRRPSGAAKGLPFANKVFQ